MGAINDLNVGAVYAISDAFSLNVKANNLLFEHYDIWYGYRTGIQRVRWFHV